MMKLNWFSPLPPARTDIAHYTTRVLPSLAQLAEVTLWTDQTEWEPSIEQLAEVRTFDLNHVPWVELNRADVNFYQIGNNPLFHSSIWQTSRLHAGVVVLHDQRLHHFFDDFFRVQRHDLGSYLTVMERYYGAAGRHDAADSFHNHAHKIDYMAEQYPLTEFAVENQLAVIVHTPEAYTCLSAVLDCPVALAPLPFTAGTRTPVTRPVGPPYQLIVFGYIGKSRRLNSVLAALASLPDKEKFQLDVYGDLLDGTEEVNAEILKLGLQDRATLHGFATETQLDQALAQSHLALNLRFPTMGEASGSQLRIWSHALPSLVSEVGWYATLPHEAVAFVRPGEHEISDIRSHLESFLSDPSAFIKMGERGRVLLETEHAPQHYAETLIAVAKLAQEFRTRVCANRLADRVGSAVKGWSTPSQFEEANSDIAGRIFELLATTEQDSI